MAAQLLQAKQRDGMIENAFARHGRNRVVEKFHQQRSIGRTPSATPAVFDVHPAPHVVVLEKVFFPNVEHAPQGEVGPIERFFLFAGGVGFGVALLFGQVR